MTVCGTGHATDELIRASISVSSISRNCVSRTGLSRTFVSQDSSVSSSVQKKTFSEALRVYVTDREIRYNIFRYYQM